MKLHRFIYIVIVFLVSNALIIGAYHNDDNMHDQRITDAYGIEEKHVVKELTPKEAVDKIENDEDFYLMMGFSSCPWCQALMPYYNQIAKEKGVKEIFYVDILEMRNNENSVNRSYYLYLWDFVKDELQAMYPSFSRIVAPTTIAVKDKVIVSMFVGTVDDHEEVDGVLPPMNDDQISRLKNILKNFFDTLK